MGFQVQFGAGANQGAGWQGDSHGSGQVLLYDANGNPAVLTSGTQVASNQGYVGVAGVDGGIIARALRVSEYSTLQVTSGQQLFQDAFEGSTVNAFWTQSTSTLTIAQATGVLTLNNAAATTLNTYAIITSQRQYPKYPRQPLFCRFRGNITAAPAANHTFVEMGIGAPATNTAVINNGAFWRMKSDGTLNVVISYNGTEQITQVLAQGGFSTTSYYYFDVIVDDDFVRFIMSDSNGVPIVDKQVSISLTVPYQWAVSHLPSFARVYVDGTGGGTAVQLKLSAHQVQLLDALNNMPWPHQAAYALRSANLSPTAYTATPSAFTAAPSTITPANGTAGANSLGGEYAFGVAVAAETAGSLFAWQIPSPYSFVLTGIGISAPVTSTAISTTGIPFIEWVLGTQGTTNTLSTANAKLEGLGIVHVASSATAAQGTIWTQAGGTSLWVPQTPRVCLPGTFIHIAVKCLGATAVTTAGVMRGVVGVDGYFL